MSTEAICVTTKDGSEIAVHDFGGSGQPLLLVHATGFHAWTLEPIARRLADRFRCFAIDSRAHGDSRAAPTWAGDWRGFADDVASVLAELGLESPVGFGHSCGGAALLMAEEADPGTFSSLYCYEPVVPPLDDPPTPNYDNPLSTRALRRRETFSSKEEAEANYGSKPPMLSFHAEALHAYVEHGFDVMSDGTVRLKCRAADEARIYANGSSHHAYGRLGDVACHVTLACGETTESFGVVALEMIARRLRKRSLEVFPGLGHFGPMEDPDALAASIIRASEAPPA
ncbi:MAG: alpha/beta fold hydrolase [Acidimicrobiales bacterium]